MKNLKKKNFRLFFNVKLDYGPNYGRSGKKEKTWKTVKVSFNAEYLCILIKAA